MKKFLRPVLCSLGSTTIEKCTPNFVETCKGQDGLSATCETRIFAPTHLCYSPRLYNNNQTEIYFIVTTGVDGGLLGLKGAWGSGLGWLMNFQLYE